MVSHIIRQYEAHAAARNAEIARETELNRAAEAEAARDRMVPLDVRLSRLLDTVPAELRREGLSLATLAGMLKGRRGGTAQTGAVGAALRRLGWTRTRCWRGGEDGGFSALWFPPGSG